MFDETLADFHVVETRVGDIPSRSSNHRLGHVDPDDAAFGPNSPRSEDKVDACARADVEHCLTRNNLRKSQRIPATEDFASGTIGQRSEIVDGVTRHPRNIDGPGRLGISPRDAVPQKGLARACDSFLHHRV
jgi:hypothetical protein